MFTEISIQQYFESIKKTPVIDVRSPKEYNHAHIPGAINLPLFDDNERAIVGITYKNDGQEEAIRKGLEIVSPKIIHLIDSAKNISQNNSIAIHCWRGGLRSKSMASLFDFAGIKTSLIKGGYKSYRRELKNILAKNFNLIILGGKTGSGKTKILQALEKQGEQIINLEKLANHKGSAFGDLGEAAQPSTEMFENLLADVLQKLDHQKRIWIEDESHLIGSIFIPEEFWEQMRNAQVLFCDIPLEERINFLIDNYGYYEKDKIILALKKISKRLGGQHEKEALNYFEDGNLFEATKTVLVYYDKAYQYGLNKRGAETIHTIVLDKINPEKNATEILQYLNLKLQEKTSLSTL